MAATYEPIASTTLASAASSVTLSSIPSTYTDLRLVAHANRSSAGTNAVKVLLNNDSGNNYSWTYLRGDGSAAASGRASSQNHIRYLQGGIAQTERDILVFDLMSYSNTSVYKTVLGATCPFEYGPGVERWVHLWRSTAAVTSVNYQVAGGASFAAGSTFSLYGIKGA